MLPRPSRRTYNGRSSSRAARPGAEALEGRQLLSTLDGGQWTYGTLVTYSFVPDGTSIGGIPSNLFQTLNSKFSTALWEQQFEKAAAVWQSVSGINLALVPDNGAPIGTSGDQQGDPRFGDIRIGAFPQQSSHLGLAFLPPPVNGGTDAGDVFLNSSINWQINQNYDLETVAIHEIGHALGMGHSAIQAADMYAYYTGVKQSLSSDDISGIQSLYGPVPTPTGNDNTPTGATDITPALNAQGQATLNGEYIAGTGDADWYKVTVPATTNGTLVVSMQSNGLSSLSPRLAVYNETSGSLQTIGQTAATNVYGTTVTYTVNNVSPGQVYYFRCSSANSGAGSNGAYAIEANFGTQPQAAAVGPKTAVAQQPDRGGGQADETINNSNTALLNLDISLFLGPIDINLKLQIGTLSVYAEFLTAPKGFVPNHTQSTGPGHHLGSHGLHRHHP